MILRTNNTGGTRDGQVPTEQFSFNYEQIHLDPRQQWSLVLLSS